MQTMDGLLTVRQVARYFQVTERTIHRWERDGVIRAIRIGGTLRFDAAVIRECVQSRHSHVNAN